MIYPLTRTSTPHAPAHQAACATRWPAPPHVAALLCPAGDEARRFVQCRGARGVPASCRTEPTPRVLRALAGHPPWHAGGHAPSGAWTHGCWPRAVHSPPRPPLVVARYSGVPASCRLGTHGATLLQSEARKQSIPATPHAPNPNLNTHIAHAHTALPPVSMAPCVAPTALPRAPSHCWTVGWSPMMIFPIRAHLY